MTFFLAFLGFVALGLGLVVAAQFFTSLTAADRWRSEVERRADGLIDLGMAPYDARNRAISDMAKEAEEALKL